MTHKNVPTGSPYRRQRDPEYDAPYPCSGLAGGWDLQCLCFRLRSFALAWKRRKLAWIEGTRTLLLGFLGFGSIQSKYKGKGEMRSFVSEVQCSLHVHCWGVRGFYEALKHKQQQQILAGEAMVQQFRFAFGP